MKKLKKIDTLKKIDILFDVYSNVLNNTEVMIFKDYYHNDYSICEIAKKRNVSRQFISGVLKSAIKDMEKFESALKIIKKNNEREKIINNIIKIVEDKISDTKLKTVLNFQFNNLIKVN